MTEPHEIGVVPRAGQDPVRTAYVCAASDDPDTRNPSLTLSAEQLVTAAEWVECGRVRLRRKIVPETRTVEIMVRREVLVIETRDVAPGPIGESFVGTALDGPVVPGPPGADAQSPLVILLREEVPEVVLRTQVYERVNTEVVTVEQVAVWHDNVRHEEVVAETRPST